MISKRQVGFVGGRFRLRVYDKNEELVRERDWQDNIITDKGLENLIDNAGWASYCYIGTGPNFPLPTDITLGNQVMTTWNVSNAVRKDTRSYYLHQNTFPAIKREITYRFAATTQDYALQEVGIGPNSGSSNLTARSLFTNSAGNPISFPLLNTEILEVIYEIRMILPTNTVSGEFKVGENTHVYRVRPCNIGSSELTGRMLDNVGNSGWYEDTIKDIFGSPVENTNSNNRLRYAAANTNTSSRPSGTKKFRYKLACNIDSAVFPNGISSARVGRRFMSWQVGFEPPVPKTLDDTFEFVLEGEIKRYNDWKELPIVDNINVGYAGRFRMSKVNNLDIETGSRDWQENLITDRGLNNICNQQFNKYCHVGLGNQNGAVAADTELEDWSMTTSQVDGVTSGLEDDGNGTRYAWVRVKYKFAQATANLDIAEVGISHEQPGLDLTTRTLLYDDQNNKETFYLEIGEMLICEYEIRMYIPNTNYVGQFNFEGRSYNYVIGPAEVSTTAKIGSQEGDEPNCIPLNYDWNSGPKGVIYKGGIRDSNSEPDGDSDDADTVAATKEAGVPAVIYRLVLGVDTGNYPNGIRSVKFNMGPLRWQLEYTPNVTKTDDISLTLPIRVVPVRA